MKKTTTQNPTNKSVSETENLVCMRPINLDIDQLTNSNPPAFAYKRDGFLYLIDLWLSQYAWRKDKQETAQGEFVPLHSQNMKSVLYDYQKYLNYLVEMAVFEVDENYKIRKRSKSYRLSDIYHKEFVKDKIRDSKLINKIKRSNQIYNKLAIERYNYITKWFDGLEIDIDGVTNFINGYINSLIYPKIHKEVRNRINLKRASYLLSVNNIYNKNYKFKVDQRGGRLYTGLTNLKKEFRKFLSYKGQSLVCIDLSNSQPFLAIILLVKSFYTDRKVTNNELLTIYNLTEYVRNNILYMIDSLMYYINTNNKEKREYKEKYIYI